MPVSTSVPGGKPRAWRMQPSAYGAPSNIATNSRRSITPRSAGFVWCAVISVPASRGQKFDRLASLPLAPLAFVVTNERLVIELVDLDGDLRHVGGHHEHRGERVLVEKAQRDVRHVVRWLERLALREHVAPHAERRHGDLIRLHR